MKESKARKQITEPISPHFYILEEEIPHSGQHEKQSFGASHSTVK
jgi:hypothetical protein